MVQEEMNEKEGLWPDIPRYLFETAKVLLDVYVFFSFFFLLYGSDKETVERNEKVARVRELKT